MALAVDASTPTAWHSGTAGVSGTTASFSPPANAFILLCITTSNDQVVGAVSNSGTALTWTQLNKDVVGSNADLELWYANTGGSAPGAIVVTATQVAGTHGGTTGQFVSMLPIVFTGAESTPGGATAVLNSTGFFTSTLTVTTRRDGSYVLGIGIDPSGSGTPTVGTAQTMIAANGDPNLDNIWAQRTTSLVATSGTATTVNDTAPGGAGIFRVIEIRAVATAATPRPGGPYQRLQAVNRAASF